MFFKKNGKTKFLSVSCLTIIMCLSFIYFMSAVTPSKDVLRVIASDNIIIPNKLALDKTVDVYETRQNNVEMLDDIELQNEFYSNITEITTKNPLLVNKFNKLPDDFEPENLVEIARGRLATPETKDAFIRLKEAAASNGLRLNLVSAYRSVEYQRKIYDDEVLRYGQEKADWQMARPGHSEHHTGRALDVSGFSGGLDNFDNTLESLWLAENAYKYGFIIRYGPGMENITGYIYEPWHITYVGTAISYQMRQEDIKSLEEYMERNPDMLNEFTDKTRKTVVIDTGYGGKESGFIWDGIEEKNINLSVAMKLKKLLIEKGYQVIMTRNEDVFMNSRERIEIANACDADVFISINQNMSEELDVHGIKIRYSNAGTLDSSDDSYNLARIIQMNFILETDANNGGIELDNDIPVISKTNMPSCSVGIGYLSNDTERSLLINDDYQNKVALGISNGIDSFLKSKVMYLTFDDGPSEKTTEAVLDILKERNVKATFFLIGEKVLRNPELTRRIVDEGHEIGIHSHSHVYKNIYESVDSFIKDFDKAYDAIFEATGVRTKLFRFPGGSVNSHNRKTYREIIEKMTDRGFIYFDWNACVDDALKDKDNKASLDMVRASVDSKDRVMMLAHDTQPRLVESLNYIIDLFSDYRMKVLTPETKPIHFPYR